VIGPISDPRLAGGVLESYRILSAALLNTLLSFGIAAEIKPRNRVLNPEQIAAPGSEPRKINPICFEVPSDYEITVNDKKVVGSAQARRREGVLQHGSIPLYGDLSRITRVLNYPNEGAQISAGLKIKERATTLEEVLAEKISLDAAGQALVNSFSSVLNLNFTPSQLTKFEADLAERLVAEKYGNDAWTYRI
jgi:lipoate-protein ligase A